MHSGRILLLKPKKEKEKQNKFIKDDNVQLLLSFNTENESGDSSLDTTTIYITNMRTQ